MNAPPPLAYKTFYHLLIALLKQDMSNSTLASVGHQFGFKLAIHILQNNHNFVKAPAGIIEYILGKVFLIGGVTVAQKDDQLLVTNYFHLKLMGLAVGEKYHDKVSTLLRQVLEGFFCGCGNPASCEIQRQDQQVKVTLIVGGAPSAAKDSSPGVRV